jgi:hypothetical protein
MSRSNNTEISNPAKRFYQWKGGEGKVEYFDKSLGEKGEKVNVPLPFTFLVLDRLSCIRGYSDADQSGFWSNEVRDLKKEQLTVRTKKGIVATNLYANLAPVLNMGAAYCQSVYIAVKGADGKLEICNIQMTGAALSEWITLCKGKDIYKYAVSITGAAAQKKGATKYFTPVFSLNPTIAEATEQQAINLDKELQEYMAVYFKRTNTEQVEHTADATATTAAVTEHSRSNGSDEYADVNEIKEAVDDLPF